MVQTMYKILHQEHYDMTGRGQEREEGNPVMLLWTGQTQVVPHAFTYIIFSTLLLQNN